jgi:hypothetical protein
MQLTNYEIIEMQGIYTCKQHRPRAFLLLRKLKDCMLL